MKLVFMGTPDIAAGVLKTLIESEHEVLGVVTQPDKPKGRGNKVEFSDVKKLALEHELPVFQPIKASEPEFVEQIRTLGPDIIIVVAYGQILRENLLTLPKYGCVNVHASLLPKYRGASPIQWAVLNGEKESGVTIMYMEKGLDTGDMILKSSIELMPDETAGSLHDRLTELAGPTLLKAMKLIESGEAKPQKQDDSEATYVGIIDKSLGNLDFSMSAATIERYVRGLSPWPGAFSYLNGRLLKIKKAALSDISSVGREPGDIFVLNKKIYIACGDGCIQVLELQPEGKKQLTDKEYLCGNSIAEGSRLSAEGK